MESKEEGIYNGANPGRVLILTRESMGEELKAKARKSIQCQVKCMWENPQNHKQNGADVHHPWAPAQGDGGVHLTPL